MVPEQHSRQAEPTRWLRVDLRAVGPTCEVLVAMFILHVAWPGGVPIVDATDVHTKHSGHLHRLGSVYV